MTKDFILKTTSGNIIRFTAYGYEYIETAPCIIFVHGFKGFKNWGFGPYIGDYLSQNGFFVLTFNFSHNGIGKSLTDFTELDKFAENTYSLEVSELNEIIDNYNNSFFGKTINKKIGVLGHSRGGAISLITVSKRNDINAVAVWSSISTFDRYSERQKKEWKEKGYFEVLNTRTNQLMRMNLSLLYDIENNRDGLLNIEYAVRSLKKPLLIVHGEQDLAVPLKEGEQIYQWSDKNITDLFIVPSAGHTFDIKHPFDGSNIKFDSVLNKTNDFFNARINVD